ncbi:hypothetical protein [Amycolatopsis nigrescens]|uniref:hypothetical protein n=1 Tax=Amycolatopsis nigrescens TaxID=381445 RepID=UPI00036B13FF|nr:hypothetical protein [Amycolatopsis nigrescens]
MTTQNPNPQPVPVLDPFIGRLSTLVTHMTWHRLGGVNRISGGTRFFTVHIDSDEDEVEVMFGHVLAWADTLRSVTVRLTSDEYFHIYVHGDLHDGSGLDVQCLLPGTPKPLLALLRAVGHHREIPLAPLRALADQIGGGR